MKPIRPRRKSFANAVCSRLFGQPFGDQKGFSLIEVVISSVFVAMIGISIAVAFLKMSHSSMWNRQAKKVGTLAVWVLERYIVLATSHLSNHDHLQLI